MVPGAEAPLVFTVTNLNAVKIFNTLTQSCFLCTTMVLNGGTESVIWGFKKELSFPGTVPFKMVSMCSERPSTVQQDCCKTTLKNNNNKTKTPNNKNLSFLLTLQG